MPLIEIMPIVVGVFFAAYVIRLSWGAAAQRLASWLVPAAVGIAFALWTVAAAFSEGPLGFWPEHTRNLWGNQIWFDLLFAAATALTFMVPRARSAGMRTVPWTLFVLATGSIGLLAMCARIAYLEGNQVSFGDRAASSTEKV